MRMLWLTRARLLPLMVAGLSIALLVTAACGGDDDNTANPSATTAATTGPGTPSAIPANVGKNDRADITGAGATFPAPLYQAWFDDYNKKVASGVKINYQSIGSGGGVQQFTAGTVDFGASDAPMSDDELKAAGAGAQHIPMVLGSVVVTYQIDGVNQAIKLDGDIVAKIYLGTIKKWSDPALAALNPGVKFPDKDINVAYRSDGSGTSFVFTDWLTKVSADWKAKVGTSKNPNWPAGQGGKGNEGVTTVVKQTPNSIGYVELSYATINKLRFADIKNKAGKFVTPSIDSTSAAAAGVSIPDDYRVSITDASGDTAYPDASITYLLVRKSYDSCSKAKPLINMLWWAFHDPGALATTKELFYAPIPANLLPRVEATLKSITCEGKPILGQ